MDDPPRLTERRKNAPSWPPSKQYEQLSSGEHLPLSGLSPNLVPQTPLSNLPSATAYSPAALLGSSSPNPDLRYKKKWYDYGWRGSTRVALLGAGTVLLVNITLAAVLAKTGENMGGGIYMIFHGRCDETERRDTWVHLALNIVATMLLASSNYCMQVLSAPTRSEIDRAHARRKWLDIGIPSIRNLGSLSKKKVLLWWILGVSSIPLHLVYNSVFYSAIATNNYNVLYATEAFSRGATYDTSAFPDTPERNVTQMQLSAASWQRLSNQDCIGEYSKDFVADRSNVIAVIRNGTGSTSLEKVALNEFPAHITADYNPFQWICDSPNIANLTGSCCENEYGFVPCPNIAPKLQQQAKQWSSGGFQIDYCLSEPVEAACHLHFSLGLMLITIFFNILKTISIAYVVFRLREQPIVTIGDAIQTFLQNPDRASEGMCLASQKSIQDRYMSGYNPIPVRCERENLRWFHSASWKQWTFIITLFVLAISCTTSALVLGVFRFSGDVSIRSPWSISLGTVRPQNLIMAWNLTGLGSWSIAVSTLVANAPQALFSFLYVAYNAIFTSLFLSAEWAKFATNRKTLRVSKAYGAQRTTYFLHLPYKYGIPLLAGSGALHWLVSQAIFLANIAVIPRDGTVPMRDEITTVAYTPLGILLVLMALLALVVFLGLVALRKLPSTATGMPLVASNSLAIAAACHVPGADQAEREDMVLLPLMWGDVEGKWVDDGSSAVGHCCFSDKAVVPPHQGRLYA